MPSTTSGGLIGANVEVSANIAGSNLFNEFKISRSRYNPFPSVPDGHVVMWLTKISICHIKSTCQYTTS